MSAQSARLGRAIRYLGVVWLIATVLLIGMTVVLGAFYRRLDQSRARANWPAYNQIALQTMTAADATQLFRDCERIAVTTVARPWVEYSERPASFARIHVDTAKPLPLRRTAANSNKSPKRKTFWLFGGSSVFGYGVPDDQTLASHLQNELQRREPNAAIVVVNHGHLGYYSSQELALLQWLVRSGQRADVAVFLDGLNDARTGNEAAGDDADPSPHHWITVDPLFPPVRFVRAILRRLPHRQVLPPDWPPPASDVEPRARAAADRLLTNIRTTEATASAFGVETLFLLQPTSFDRGPKSDAVEKRVRALGRWNPVLQPFNAIVRREGANVVDLTGAFENQSYAQTYVDPWHYGDDASRRLASMIADVIIKRGLVTESPQP